MQMRTFKLIIYFILVSNGYSSQVEDVSSKLPVDDIIYNDLAFVEASQAGANEGQVSTFKITKRKFLKNVLGNPLLGGTGSNSFIAFAKADIGCITKENSLAKKSDVLKRALHFHTHQAPPSGVIA